MCAQIRTNERKKQEAHRTRCFIYKSYHWNGIEWFCYRMTLEREQLIRLTLLILIHFDFRNLVDFF
jgi:hypothetical protein